MEEKIRIKNIHWDRIYLHIELQESIPEERRFFIVNEEAGKRYPLPCSGHEICVNITTVTQIRGEEMLCSGDWRLVSCVDGEDESPLTLCRGVAGKLDSLDKVFPYWRGAYAYIVIFEPEEKGQDLCVIMKTAYMQKNLHPNRESIALETESPAQACKKAAVLFTERLYRLFYRFLCTIRKKDGKHILLMSETKTALTSNLKAIDRRLKERGLAEKLTVSYSFHETLHMSSLAVALYWIKLIVCLAKQDFVLIDDYAPVFKALDLDRRTKLVQVWHAGLGFKSVGYSRFGKKDSPRPLSSCHRKYDYVVVGSKNLIPVYQEVFGVSREKFLPLGVPRVDDFLRQEDSEQYREQFYKQYPQAKGKKLILFAPTYRGSGQQEAFYPYSRLDLKQLWEFCGGEYIFAFKMHPFIKKGPEIEGEWNSRILDLSGEDVNSLLRICDILITDYSSVIYEFVLLERPILFYAFDKEEYSAVRGFHWDFDQYAPGQICETFGALMEALEKKEYGDRRRQVFREFGYEYTDGGSTDRLIDFLFLHQCEE